MPILLILIVIAIAIASTPYVLLYWLIKPMTAMGYFGVFCLGSFILLMLAIIVGIIQNHRANKG